METDTDIHFVEEIPTKKIPLSPEVFRVLKRRAKADGITTDEYVERLLLGIMYQHLDYVPAVCPCCKKEIAIPTKGPPITLKEFQLLAKDQRSLLNKVLDLQDSKRKKA